MKETQDYLMPLLEYGETPYFKVYDISENDINSLYPIFSIAEDYESLISILSISVERDSSNMEYLEVLRNAYIKVKDYENAENIYQIILKNEE